MWLSFMIYGTERKAMKDRYTYIAETRLTQHFFFFTKRKPVLKEKRICSFGKAFLSAKRFD